MTGRMIWGRSVVEGRMLYASNESSTDGGIDVNRLTVVAGGSGSAYAVARCLSFWMAE